MLTTNYILNDIKPLSYKDNVQRAQSLFDQLPHSHLPVLDQNVFCGLIAREIIEFPEFDNKSLFEIKN